MQIEFRNGLLFTTMNINYHGRTKSIDNMVIDTGAAKTLISQHAVDDIGLRVEMDDHIVTYFGIGGKEHAFTKRLDSVSIGNYNLTNCEIDFSGMDYEGINGLLGLDILLEGNFIVDLEKLEIYQR